MKEKTGIWIGVISTVTTIILTILVFHLSQIIQLTEDELKLIRAELEKKIAAYPPVFITRPPVHHTLHTSFLHLAP